MCTLSNLQRMAESNKMIVSLMIDQLVKFGQEKEEQLTSSAKTRNDLTEKIIFPLEDQLRFNKLFSNIIQLAKAEDAECKQACAHYILSFTSILKSYPTFEKLEMSDALIQLYDEFCNIHKGEDAQQDLYLGISEIRNLLYK